MNKKAVILFLLLLVMIATTGCLNRNAEEPTNAVEIAHKYKKAELEAIYLNTNNEVTQDQILNKENSIKLLTTESFFEKNTKNRFFIRSSNIAQITKDDVILQDISFDKGTTSEDNIVLNYSSVFVYSEGKINLIGTIALVKENGLWKVNRDVYNSDEILKIIDSYLLKHRS